MSKKWLFGIFSVILIVGLTSMIFPLPSTTESATQGDPQTFSLAPPPFIAVVSAAEPLAGGTAFPQSEAGFCSWVLVSEPIDLEKAVTVFTQIDELGLNHTRGTFSLSNYQISQPILGCKALWNHDAYFDYTDPASQSINWQGQNFNAPVIAFVTDRAIEQMCTALGISYGAYESQLQRYDFNYPAATTMMVFENTNAGGTDDYVTFLFPESHTLYEASYSLASTNQYVSTTENTILYHDGVQVRKCTETVCIGKYDLSMYLSQGESHTLRTWIDYIGGSANVFLYSV